MVVSLLHKQLDRVNCANSALTAVLSLEHQSCQSRHNHHSHSLVWSGLVWSGLVWSGPSLVNHTDQT